MPQNILNSLAGSRNDGQGDAFTTNLSRNVDAWSAKTAEADPKFFETTAKGQSPKILWIGCADSRIPETTILGLKPGEVFVHRNIANILQPADVNSLSVIEYAVAHLKVDHVVVCGHTSCGGVNAALGNQKLGVIDLWLQPMRLLRMRHGQELDALEGDAKSLRLSQLNVKNSLLVLKMNPTIIEAMKTRGLQVHGVMYNLHTGKLDGIETEEKEEELKERLAAFETRQ